MNVQFIYPEVALFKEKVLPLHGEVLEATPKLKPIYDKIQEIGKQIKEGILKDVSSYKLEVVTFLKL